MSNKVGFATITAATAEDAFWPDWPKGLDCDGIMALTEHEYKTAQKLVNARLKFQRALAALPEGEKKGPLTEAVEGLMLAGVIGDTTITYADMESMYFDQCRRTDHFIKLAEEHGDAALTARIAELEKDLAAMNERYVEYKTAHTVSVEEANHLLKCLSDCAKVLGISVDEHIHTGVLDAVKLLVGSAYPATLEVELNEVLGLMNYETGPIAHVYQQAGVAIRTKCEDEQAFVLDKCIRFYIKDPKHWRSLMVADIKAMEAKIKAAQEPSITAVAATKE